MESEYWATPFEVHLAARKFNCVIHLFHSEPPSAVETHYCFQPDHRHRSSGSVPLPNLFLKSEIKDGEFWFQWYQVSPKLFRADTLWSALHKWLNKVDVRPITADLLGANEHDFKNKCSKILMKALSKDSSHFTVGVERMLCISPRFDAVFFHSHLFFSGPISLRLYRVSIPCLNSGCLA